MKTWFDFDTQRWVSDKPKRYWTNIECVKTKERIYIGDVIMIDHVIWSDSLKKLITHKEQLQVCEGHYSNFIQHLNPILIKH